jgi:hypothetical protein
MLPPPDFDSDQFVQAVRDKEERSAASCWDGLTKRGCNRESLAELLWVAASFARARDGIKSRGGTPPKLLWGMSRDQARRFPARLREIADSVEAVNNSRASPSLEIRRSHRRLGAWASPEKTPGYAEEFDRVPEILRVYAAIFRQASAREKPSARYQRVEEQEAALIEYVEHKTGESHFEEIATLLRAAYQVLDPKQYQQVDRKWQTSRRASKGRVAPNPYSADALKLRYRRFAKKERRPFSVARTALRRDAFGFPGHLQMP